MANEKVEREQRGNQENDTVLENTMETLQSLGNSTVNNLQNLGNAAIDGLQNIGDAAMDGMHKIGNLFNEENDKV